MKKIISILFAFVTVLSIDAFAAWTVVSEGNVFRAYFFLRNCLLRGLAYSVK